MPTTSSSSLRYPSSSAAPNVPQDMQNLATDLDRKVIPSFANIAARTAAIPSPTLGQTCSVAGVLHTYDGTAWRWQRTGIIGSQSTNTSGFLSVSHGLGATPTGVIITSGDQATDLLSRVLTFNVSSRDSTAFHVYVHRSDTGAPQASTTVQFYWIAFV